MTNSQTIEHSESSQWRIRSWLDAIPVVPVVVGLGVLLSLFAWSGLRGVENDAALVNHDRRLLQQGTQLRSEIERQTERQNEFVEVVLSGELPVSLQVREIAGLGPAEELSYIEVLRTPEAAEALLQREKSQGNTAFVEEFGEAASGDIANYPLFVLSRSVPGEGAITTPSGLVFAQDSGIAELVFEAQKVQGTTAVVPGSVAEVMQSVGLWSDAEISGSSAIHGNVILLSAVRNGELVQGLIIRRIEVDRLLRSASDVFSSNTGAATATGSDELPAAFVLSMNGDEVFRSTAVDRLDPVSEPVTLSAGGTTWRLQGMRQGLREERTTSSVALLAGIAASAMLGMALQAMQRHALTAGRLERSEFDASHDSLTGLLNRAGVTDVLSNVLDQRSDTDIVGILFLDLDRLKVINDSIGHSAGDEVLVIVAERLSSILRGGDVIGRFGGDEFIIVSREAKAVGDLTRLSERVLEALKEPATLSDDSTQVLGASIGIAYVGAEEATAEDLLRDADLAMYRAKGAGGGRYELFDANLRAEALARLEVERELRRAIRTGQLVVHYQPIVELTTGHVNRVEALVRWQHPVRGMVPPGAFLSVAAESGLIVDVGEHVLREACRQAALWSVAVGREVLVSVNVAERQLLDASLVDTVRRVISETGIKPSQLELELTEELIVERLDSRLTALYELVNMGVKLAIDDFGTSRASLSQLKRLDMVDTLKIDRAFVIDVANDAVDRKIITAIVALAESVGMEIVAEGVEDRDQVEVLQDLGVDLIQGFYFHRPAPAEQIVTILTKTFDIPVAASTTKLELT